MPAARAPIHREVQVYYFMASDYGARGDLKFSPSPPKIRALNCKIILRPWGKERWAGEQVRITNLPPRMYDNDWKNLIQAIKAALADQHGIQAISLAPHLIMEDDCG